MGMQDRDYYKDWLKEKERASVFKRSSNKPWHPILLFFLTIVICGATFLVFKVIARYAPLLPNLVQKIDTKVTESLPRVQSEPMPQIQSERLPKPQSKPLIAGAVCNATLCKCVTSDGSDTGLSDSQCRAWLNRHPVNSSFL